MQQRSIELLEKNYGHWITLRDAQYLKNLDYSVKEEIQEAACTEIGLCRVNLWCGACLADLVTRIYTHYDKWKLHTSDSDNRG